MPWWGWLIAVLVTLVVVAGVTVMAMMMWAFVRFDRKTDEMMRRTPPSFPNWKRH